MTPHTECAERLSVHRSFVVQFDAGTVIARGRVKGRIEHIVTGQTACFHSTQQLLDFVVHVLCHMGTTEGHEEAK